MNLYMCVCVCGACVPASQTLLYQEAN